MPKKYGLFVFVLILVVFVVTVLCIGIVWNNLLKQSYKLTERPNSKSQGSYFHSRLGFAVSRETMSKSEFKRLEKPNKRGSESITNDVESSAVLDDYFCSATCYCEGEERRNVAVSSKHLLSFAFAAASYSIAMTIGDRYFQRECKKSFSETCNGAVVTQVDECVKKESVFKGLNKRGQLSDGLHQRHYLCSGKCRSRVLPNGDFIDGPSYECGRKGIQVFVLAFGDEIYSERNARLNFIHEHLAPFCKALQPEITDSGEQVVCYAPSSDFVRCWRR